MSFYSELPSFVAFLRVPVPICIRAPFRVLFLGCRRQRLSFAHVCLTCVVSLRRGLFRSCLCGPTKVWKVPFGVRLACCNSPFKGTFRDFQCFLLNTPNHVCGCSAAALRRLGGISFSWKLAQEGCRILFVKGCVLLYRCRESGCLPALERHLQKGNSDDCPFYLNECGPSPPGAFQQHAEKNHLHTGHLFIHLWLGQIVDGHLELR